MKMATYATTKPITVSEISCIPYTCPNCGARVGDFVEDNGGVRLDAGGWLIGDGKKHCHRCGRLIHVKAPKESWGELVKRYVKRMASENGNGNGHA